MYLINRHLLSTATGPFFFGWFVITFLLMIDVLFRYVDLFVSKGVPFWMATKVLALSLGHTFALSVPMAVLIAILMGVGQLATDHEITAMKASGIGLWAVLRPLILGAFVISVGLTAYNHYVFPKSNHMLASLLFDINRKKPMLEIREQQWTEMSDHTTIHVVGKDDLTGRIEDVTIIEKENPGDLSPRFTTAEWGRIVPDHATDSMLIELHDGEIHERQERDDPDRLQIIRFRQHNLYVENVERDFHESGRKSKSDREMDLKELWAAAGREHERQTGVGRTVGDLTTSMLAWQWRLLDRARRHELLGQSAAPADSLQRDNFLQNKFKTTRMKVDRVIEQAQYQERIRDNYQAKENRYLVEFHKKFAIPFACVVFALLGVPMAVTTSRSGKGISVSLALGVYLVYYLFLVGGEKFSDRGRLDPFLAMWMANFVLMGLGIPLFFKAVRESTLLSITLKPKAADDAVTGNGAG